METIKGIKLSSSEINLKALTRILLWCSLCLEENDFGTIKQFTIMILPAPIPKIQNKTYYVLGTGNFRMGEGLGVIYPVVINVINQYVVMLLLFCYQYYQYV